MPRGYRSQEQKAFVVVFATVCARGQPVRSAHEMHGPLFPPVYGGASTEADGRWRNGLFFTTGAADDWDAGP